MPLIHTKFDRAAGWKGDHGKFVLIKELNDYGVVFAYTCFRNRVKYGREAIARIIEKDGAFTDAAYQSWLNRHVEIMGHLRGEMRKRKLIMTRVLANAETQRKDDKGKTS